MQVYSLLPEGQDASAHISFLAAIQEPGGVRRVLIGRSALVTNPLTQPLLSSLGSMDELGGAGILLDESQRVLYRSSDQAAISVFEGLDVSRSGIQENTASDGTRQLVYYRPVPGSPWSVVLTVPARQSQQIALEIAVPLSVLVFLLALAALILLRFGLRAITGSLTSLSVEANRIAQGQLDHPVALQGADEVFQLRRAFEQMRASLQARLEELNRLLHVTQSVASTLDLEDALRPVLEAFLSTGASSVRIVLKQGDPAEAAAETAPPQGFHAGPAAMKYAHLDEAVLQLARGREQITIPSLAISRELPLNLSMSNPAALLVVSLRHENRYYGVLWAGFEQVRSFSDSDVRFAITLAGQAALAVTNAFLFQNVEAGRRQLEAILNSTPDPVLVTDHKNRLLLSNRAANRALGLDSTRSTGQPTERVIQQRLLFDLLQSSLQQQQSAEIVLKDKRTYLATASTVKVEGRPVGRVCILRDVTHFKELDTMKSEFVATVSHDLRSPLTLMRGYATMLPMVGELNEQQQSYARKIISGVENMSQLVNNLLDLGRIEGGVGLELGRVPVLDILERVTGSLQQQAEQKKVTLKLELPKDMPHAVQADAALLYQAVYNLVENAIKYTPEEGCVTIAVQSDPEALILEVTDTGIGISAEDLPRLFEKFFRGSQREARAQHGSGLGLAIVHSIAERHGGRVWVESQPGKGSTFRLLIPLTQRNPAQPPD
jgi:PAS domain S-box-containing protein